MDDTFSQTGGARLDWLNATFPMARISADTEAIRLSCVGRDYIFPKRSVRRLSKHRGLFSIGLRIEHDDESLPAFVVFWTSLFFSSAPYVKLRERLESLGYEVAS